MGKIKRYRNVISRFISSEGGQRFFNFAYSIGAAIVIWGALFKILHLPGGNTLLSIGMGTEVLMFILTAFDRPPHEYKWEKVYPALIEGEEEPTDEHHAHAKGAEHGTTVIVNGLPAQGGTVIAGGGHAASNQASSTAVGIRGGANVTGVTETTGDVTGTTANVLDQMQAMATEMQQLKESTHRLNEVSDTLLQSYRAITDNSENITASSTGYVDQMQALNRNIQGLNTIYEIQLKSVSSQLDAIDRVNRGIKEISDMYVNTAGNTARYSEEAEKLAENMKRLNEVYEKMLTAMTINMAPGMPRQ